MCNWWKMKIFWGKPKSKENNCFSTLPHSAVIQTLIKTNRGLTSELFAFAATAVRQLWVRGLAGLLAPLPRLRLGLCRLLPRQGPLLCLGRVELLTLLPHREKVETAACSFSLCSSRWRIHESSFSDADKVQRSKRWKCREENTQKPESCLCFLFINQD